MSDEIKITYIGGPTALLEVAGLSFLTDPTFDSEDTKYRTKLYVLHKLKGPSLMPKDLPEIDAVLLTHDHHYDNLDFSGRDFLPLAKKVFTTPDGAARLDGNAVGLQNWETVAITSRDGRVVLITGTPCRHGPEGGDRGPVTGFVLQFKNEEGNAVYITGDSVWYAGLEEVAARFNIGLVIPFVGAAVVTEVGPAHLTMTAKETVELAKRFDKAIIVPLHFEGWEHFRESKQEIESEFMKAGLLHRLQWPVLPSMANLT
jgi:L-ascorbate metabolism protein UlaG (beta-lactamase superfamily)